MSKRSQRDRARLVEMHRALDQAGEEHDRARRAAGRLLLEEVADELADKTGASFERWLDLVLRAVSGGELKLLNPENVHDNLPFEPPKSSSSEPPAGWLGESNLTFNPPANWRPLLDQVRYDDVNAWLDRHDWTEHRVPHPADLTKVAATLSGVPGLTKAQILACKWPTTANLQRALSDVPDWLKQARVSRGSAGRSSSTWNPAMLAVCLCAHRVADRAAADTHIRSHFPNWIGEWEERSEHL